jgi:effector-binding domain-containing protein
VAFDDTDAWCTRVFDELHAVLDADGAAASGPDGALYSSEFFEAGAGPVTAFVPLLGAVSPTGSFAAIELPAVDVAVMVHDGPFGDLDQTYGALGTVVAERGVGADGPIREHYASDDLTEVCWPITTIPGGNP